MPTVDLDAIVAAIIARYQPGVVTPPAGVANVRAALVDVPNVAPERTVMLFPDGGELDYNSGGKRTGYADFLLRYYFGVASRGDLPRQTNYTRKWIGVLVDQIPVGYSGGVTGVAVIRVMGWRGPVTIPHGDRDYTGLELRLRATLAHGWSG